MKNVSSHEEERVTEFFRNKLRKIENGAHFEEKYNIDQIINNKYGNIAKTVLKNQYDSIAKKKKERRV